MEFDIEPIEEELRMLDLPNRLKVLALVLGDYRGALTEAELKYFTKAFQKSADVLLGIQRSPG